MPLRLPDAILSSNRTSSHLPPHRTIQRRGATVRWPRRFRVWLSLSLSLSEVFMYAANSYVLRLANEADAPELTRLAALDSRAPLTGSILIGELHGEPAAALSLTDDPVIAVPFRRTAHLVTTMRRRAGGLRAVEHMPSLRDRLLAGLPPSYRARLAGGGA